MKIERPDTRDIEQEVLREVRTLVKGLPEEAAKVSVELPSNVHGPILKVVPRSEGAAEIVIHIESPQQLDLTIGRGCHFELYEENQRELLEELRRFLRAVVEGRLEETVWIRGDTVLKSKGRVGLETKTIRISYRNMVVPKRGARTKQRFVYQPYS